MKNTDITMGYFFFKSSSKGQTLVHKAQSRQLKAKQIQNAGKNFKGTKRNKNGQTNMISFILFVRNNI